jgi:hypothetical protein
LGSPEELVEGHIRPSLIACDEEDDDKLLAELNGGDIPVTGFAVAAADG